MYELLEKLEALIEKWLNEPYNGVFTESPRALCAKELRAVIGLQKEKKWIYDPSSNDSTLQKGYYEDDPPF